MKQGNKEYLAVIEVLKTSQARRQLSFLVTPFCRLGYDDMVSTSENKRKMVG